MKQVISLIKKDVLLEMRQQHTFFGILLYVASTIFVLYLAMNRPDAVVYNGLFWMIQLFVCVNAVAKSFLQESRGRMLYFYTLCSPAQFVVAKLIYSGGVMLIMTILSILLFLILLGNPASGLMIFGLIAVFGGISLSMVFTLMAAIAAKAQQNSAIVAILGFPLIIPQLLILMKLSRFAFGEVFNEGAVWQLIALLSGLDILVLALSLILFPFLWKD